MQEYEKLNQIGPWRLALVYAGCFLGAGYVSGQEMWQFFGAFGIGGLWGLGLCTLLQGAFCVILMSLVRRGGVRDPERAAVRRDRPVLRALIGGAQLVLLFGVTVIMSAGAGALTAQMLGRGSLAASLIFCAAVAWAALRGMRGLVRVFSLVVPLLIAAALGVALWALIRFGWGSLTIPAVTHGAGSPLLSHWAVAAVSFVSYNLFGSVAVLVPIAQTVPSARVARRGAVIGALFLLLVACAILLSLYLCPEVVAHELPMLALAERLSPAMGWVYAVLLLAAMFGTALSCTVAAQTYLAQKSHAVARRPAAVILPFAALAFLGGLFGFGDLIGWIYPIFGYLGFAVLCSVAAHERYVRRSGR